MITSLMISSSSATAAAAAAAAASPSMSLIAKGMTARYLSQMVLRPSPKALGLQRQHHQHHFYQRRLANQQIVFYHDTKSDQYFASRWSGDDGKVNGGVDGDSGTSAAGKGLNTCGIPVSHHHDEGSAPVMSSIPQRVRQKLISASDAVALVRDGDTVCVSGFVTQGCAEAVCKALGERFEETRHPQNLTLLFGGGPGDYGKRGLSHFAKIADDGSQMITRTVGGHYGQVPGVAAMVLDEKVEAWTLPMGSISRMIRAQSTHSPGHITTIGIGTYVDPDLSGGAANESAKRSPFHKELVTKINIQNQTYLNYKAIPIDVAIIRGTTADTSGNISIEHESLMCDQQIVAAAAKNSGGLVIAQVKRVAANGSIPSRQVAIPGPLVDCVVVVDDDDVGELHPMSYVTKFDAALVGEVKTPQESLAKMPLDIRKIIARRAFFGLKPNTIVNLGIGLPEGVASVAAEEGMLDYITLSTEPGVFGGLPASGHDFGPAYNASSLIQMNQMFDFYDGGGLDMCFLGAAEVSSSGDINVSRMNANRLTGPGGFIDISQSTRNVCFMTPLTTGGLKVEPGDGKLNIVQEGKVKKFVPEVYEKTFSGDEAVRRGQKVFYVTERAVFRRSSQSDKIELIEIAPGVDLQKDVIDQMGFQPAISPDLKEMDPRIFTDAKMKASKDFFGSLEDRHVYREEDHTVFLELLGIVLNSQDDIDWFEGAVRKLLEPYFATKGPINMVVDYQGFEIGKGLEEYYSEKVKHLQQNFYKTVVRYSGAAFQRAKLKSQLKMEDQNPDDLFDEFASHPESDRMSLEELREGFLREFQIQLTPTTIRYFVDGDEASIDREQFKKGMKLTLANKQ